MPIRAPQIAAMQEFFEQFEGCNHGGVTDLVLGPFAELLPLDPQATNPRGCREAAILFSFV